MLREDTTPCRGVSQAKGERCNRASPLTLHDIPETRRPRRVRRELAVRHKQLAERLRAQADGIEQQSAAGPGGASAALGVAIAGGHTAPARGGAARRHTAKRRAPVDQLDLLAVGAIVERRAGRGDARAVVRRDGRLFGVRGGVPGGGGAGVLVVGRVRPAASTRWAKTWQLGERVPFAMALPPRLGHGAIDSAIARGRAARSVVYAQSIMCIAGYTGRIPSYIGFFNLAVEGDVDHIMMVQSREGNVVQRVWCVCVKGASAIH